MATEDIDVDADADFEVSIAPSKEDLLGNEPANAGADKADVAAEPPKPKPKPAADPGKSEDEWKREIAAVKAEAQRERSGREQAERAAREHQERAGRSEYDRRGSDLAMIDNAISDRNARLDMMERDLAEAQTMGDMAKAAKITRSMSGVSAELLQLNQGKAQGEAEYKQYQAQLQQQQQRQQQQPQIDRNADPVEHFLASNRIGGRSADWIRENPDVVGRPKRLIAAHEAAVEEGHRIESPEYFASVGQFMGLARKPAASSGNGNGSGRSRQDDDDDDTPLHRMVGRRPVAASAPPTRRATLPSGRESETVKLTAAQRKAAEISGVTPEEYARSWLEAKRNGEYPTKDN